MVSSEENGRLTPIPDFFDRSVQRLYWERPPMMPKIAQKKDPSFPEEAHIFYFLFFIFFAFRVQDS